MTKNTKNITKKSKEGGSRHHKVIYASSYDRGLQHLLKMWPKIIEKYPDATLDIYYGWNLFLTAYRNNPERMDWKDRMDKQMEQKGITNHGRVGQPDLKKAREKCGIWAYTTDFDEINCITALECQRDGCVPCVINRAALKETVGSGVRIEGAIYDPEVQEEYLKELLLIMGDEKRWKSEQTKGKEFAKAYTWDKIAKQWDTIFRK